MMTNKQTIGGVSIALLKRLAVNEDLFNRDQAEAVIELRALLNKPVNTNGLSLGGRLARAATGLINVLDDETQAWTETEALKQALEDWSMAKPAAQHQGEPVLIQAVAVTREDDDEGLRLEWLLEGGIAEMEFAGMVLFALPEANDLCDEDGSAEIYLSPQQAERPAPVAESTSSDKYKAELYDEVWQKARDMGFANVTDALAKLVVPAAVVLPGRKAAADYRYMRKSDGENAANIYNSALDDTTRLNTQQ